MTEVARVRILPRLILSLFGHCMIELWLGFEPSKFNFKLASVDRDVVWLKPSAIYFLTFWGFLCGGGGGGANISTTEMRKGLDPR